MSAAWRERPVLVTGATGLLGGWVAEALVARGAHVIALVRDEVPDPYLRLSGVSEKCVIVRGDIGDLMLLERILTEYEVDAIFHLAAQSQVGVARAAPFHTLEANVRGSYVLLEAARRYGKARAILVASSDKAYGESPELPYVESMPLRGENPYDVSKAAADLIARAYARSYHMPVIVTRCGNLFGGGDLNWARLVPGTIRALLRGDRPLIRSDGTPVRDYLYVGDAAEAYVAAAERAQAYAGEAFNFSLERPLTVLEMLALIGRAVGASAEPVIANGAVGEIAQQYLSAERARDVLGWRPSIGLEEGLRRTVEWYRRYLG